MRKRQRKIDNGKYTKIKRMKIKIPEGKMQEIKYYFGEKDKEK